MSDSSATSTPTLPQRDLLVIGQPEVWSLWPLLPLVRRHPNRETEFGVLYDALNACGRTGLGATVFFTNVFQLPSSLEEFLALPKEVHDTPEEIVAAGWRVD